jgi:hypothetical protein
MKVTRAGLQMYPIDEINRLAAQLPVGNPA